MSGRRQTIRALPVDPSNLVDGGDPLGTVLLDGMPGRIHILGAKQYEGGRSESFSAVENDIARTYHKVGADALPIEANSMGRRMAYALEHEHMLKVIPINTVHGSASRGTGARAEGTPKINRLTLNSMDKMEHINWLVKMQNEGDILWPDIINTRGLRELERQWSIFGEYHKDRLEAPPDDHDDLMMSLAIGTYYLRHMIVEGSRTGTTHVMGGVPHPMSASYVMGARNPDYRHDGDVRRSLTPGSW